MSIEYDGNLVYILYSLYPFDFFNINRIIVNILFDLHLYFFLK